MSDEPKKFLARWSSRKLASRTQEPSSGADARQHPPDQANAAEDRSIVAARTEDTPADRPFDPSQLPPLDSIGPNTDVAAFLRRDVPPELTRAALRRAWTSDPAIKNFVGLVENGWDFNDPSAMPGFGPISPEEVARLAGNVIAALPDVAPASDATQLPGEKDRELASSRNPPTQSLEAPQSEKPPQDRGNVAAQQNETGDKG